MRSGVALVNKKIIRINKGRQRDGKFKSLVTFGPLVLGAKSHQNYLYVKN